MPDSLSGYFYLCPIYFINTKIMKKTFELSVTNGDHVEIFDVLIETNHVKLEFIVLELFAQGVEDLLEDKGDISVRLKLALGHIREVTHKYSQAPGKKKLKNDCQMIACNNRYALFGIRAPPIHNKP